MRSLLEASATAVVLNSKSETTWQTKVTNLQLVSLFVKALRHVPKRGSRLTGAISIIHQSIPKFPIYPTRLCSLNHLQRLAAPAAELAPRVGQTM